MPGCQIQKQNTKYPNYLNYMMNRIPKNKGKNPGLDIQDSFGNQF